MSFTVVYTRDADNILARAWLSAKDRRSVTDAQYQIDQQLTRDPKNPGQEITEGLWRIEAGPLAAYYEIDDAVRVVTVTSFGVLPATPDDLQ